MRGFRVALLVVLSGALWLSPVSAGDADANIDELEARVDDLLLRFTEKHPDVVALRAAIRDLRAIAAGGAQQHPPVLGNSAGEQFEGDTRSATDRNDDERPRSLAETRETRSVRYQESFDALCNTPGVVACFDFEGQAPLASRVGSLAGELLQSSDGIVRARIEDGAGLLGEHSLHMDFRAEDGSDHGAFVVIADEFKEGDYMTVQWRQWFSPELVTTFSRDNRPQLPQVGGDGAAQIVISEIGPREGCTFGELVANNYSWSGILSMYHGCGLWYTTRTDAPIGVRDSTDFDLQPGGDTACRYRYFYNRYPRKVDYLYPTEPADIRTIPEFADIVRPAAYHGCLGWRAGQWMTFRIEVKIAYCRDSKTGDLPPACMTVGGRLRYWLKYADEDKPWLVLDYPLALRWLPSHSERYGRFMFTPYNSNESPRKGKPPGFTRYDDIVIAKNVRDLPWPRH